MMAAKLAFGRLRNIAVATLSMVVMGTPLLMTIGAKPERAATGLLLFSLGLGAFEEFYIQGQAGAWLRRLHPLVSLPVSIGVAFVIAFAAAALMLVLWDDFGRIGMVMRALFWNTPILLLIATGLTLTLRTISFVGGRTLLHLITGRYHRPVSERRVLAFVDVKQSTAMVEHLGPLRGRQAVGGIVSLLSRLVIEHGGDVYIYTGDGLIGSWQWGTALRDENILRFALAALRAVKQSAPGFSRTYGFAPAIRIGIHGGDVIVSEQGDLRRAIGIWGDVINIAARLEQAGKELGVDCIISKDVVENLDSKKFELKPLEALRAKGISHRIDAFYLAEISDRA